jgi:hypothetical protein
MKQEPDNTPVYVAEERIKRAISVIAHCAEVARKRCEQMQIGATNAPDLHRVIKCKRRRGTRQSKQDIESVISESRADVNGEVVTSPHILGSFAALEKRHARENVEDVCELSREQYLDALCVRRKDVPWYSGTSTQAAKRTCVQQQTTYAPQDFCTSSSLPRVCPSNGDKVFKNVERTPMVDTSDENVDKLELLSRATASKFHTHRDAIISTEVDIATSLQQLASSCGAQPSIAIESRPYLCNKIFKNMEHRVNVHSNANAEKYDEENAVFSTSKWYKIRFPTDDTFALKNLSLHYDSQTHFLGPESHSVVMQSTSGKHAKKAKTGFCLH